MGQNEKKIGLFAGSFDPVTRGHIDIIERSAQLVDQLYISIGAQHKKTALFSPTERIEILKDEISAENVDFTTFSGLLVEEAKRLNVSFLIRSIRNIEDFEYEKTLAIMNNSLSGIETINLFANPAFSHISSSIVKQIAHMDGDISKFVTPNVANLIKQKIKG